MGSEEPLTNREILSRFEEVRRNQEALDTRVSKVAQDSVSTETWARENGHIQKDIAEVDAHCEERHLIVMDTLGELKKSIEKRSDLTWQRVLGILSILAVLAAAWYTALHTGGH